MRIFGLNILTDKQLMASKTEALIDIANNCNKKGIIRVVKENNHLYFLNTDKLSIMIDEGNKKFYRGLRQKHLEKNKKRK
jgi:hypothetical protein